MGYRINPITNKLESYVDISGKVDKIASKGLSTNDFTDTYKNNSHTSGSDNQDLSGLEPKQTGKSLSTNDLTAELKTSYDGAVSHAGSAHAPSGAQANADITKAEIEAKLTGTISSHSHTGGAGDMVLDSVQSVTGLKTFDTTKLAIKGSSTGATAIASANASATPYTATLPAKDGTVAMLTDIHAAVTVSAPISLSTQAISIVNDAAATITEVDTGVLGNVDTTIPTSKVVTTAIGTHAALKTGVHGLLNSVRVRTQVTPTAKTAAVTLTIAELLTGIITGNPAAAVAYTLPTGTLCEGGLTIAVDEAFDWVLSNIATTATYIITLTAGTAHTIVGCAKIPSNSTTTGGLWGTAAALFRTRKTATNTFVTYRIG